MSDSRNEAKAPFVTFYSFKGGVGRSMALINVAGILAGRGFRVLAIDVDLEAPGISYLTEQAGGREQPGFVDVIANVLERGAEADMILLSAQEVVEKYSFEMEVPEGLRTSEDGVLRIMPAGRLDAGYSSRLEGLGLGQLYLDGYGKPIIQAIKNTIQEAEYFDVVLVDSRTGFSEEGGICTRDLADHVVVVMGLNRQNVRGTAAFLEALRSSTSKTENKGIRVVLSPVPNGEDELVDERKAAAKEALQAAWGAEISLELQIPYHPRLALTEEPHIFRRSRGYLYEAYVKLERVLTELIGFDGLSILRKVKEAALAKNVQGVIRGIEMLGKLDVAPGEAVLSDPVKSLYLDPKHIELRKMLAETLPAGSYAASIVASDLARNDLFGAELLFKRSIEAQPNDPRALGSYAHFLTTVRGDHDGAEDLYKRAIQFAPNHATILGNYANFLSTVRGDHDGAEELYKRALEADPKQANNLGNYAKLLFVLQRGEEAVACMNRAFSL
ncbi:MAG: tetratricopeptide repeat protein, partial [Nannocystaceae bacterium]